MRLSYDALVILSHLGPGETITIEHIATNIFGARDKEGVRKQTKVSKMRAIAAAKNLAGSRKVTLLPSRDTVTSITATHKDGGLQAQALMNMVCRAGVDRRKIEAPLPEGVEEDRRTGERRSDERTAIS